MVNAVGDSHSYTANTSAAWLEYESKCNNASRRQCAKLRVSLDNSRFYTMLISRKVGFKFICVLFHVGSKIRKIIKRYNNASHLSKQNHYVYANPVTRAFVTPKPLGSISSRIIIENI